MRFWLSLNFEPMDQLLDHARDAEAFGFEGVVLPDHVVIKDGPRTPHPKGYPLQADEPFLDPLCVFSAMAAVTTRLRFLNYVYVVPLRDPFSLAKQAGTVSVISAGRFVLGTGTGWLREEFETLGPDFASRGRRMDEMLAIVRDFWDDGYAEHHGEHFDFPRSGMFPVPPSRVPIWIGGHSMVAARRAARFDGYMPMTPLDEPTIQQFRAIDAIRAELGLTGPFERMAIPPLGGIDAGRVRELEDLGVTSVLVIPWTQSDPSVPYSKKRDAAERFAREVIAPSAPAQSEATQQAQSEATQQAQSEATQQAQRTGSAS
jgi:probable F420-dependent oxidoreductase